jgi:hypothetical protein
VTLSVGDRVRDIAFHKGLTGTVSEVIPGSSVSDHGSITIKVDSQHIGKFSLNPSDEEHYVEFEWWKTLKKETDV